MRGSSCRILMTSDLHLSNSLPMAVPSKRGRTDRLDDQLRMLKWIGRTAVERRCESIWILGDVFDKSRVDAVTMPEATKALVELASESPVYILAGNHDAQTRAGGRFVVEAYDSIERSNIHYLRRKPIALRPWLKLWPFPFSSLKMAEKRLVRANAELDSELVNVNLMHHSILGAEHEGWTCNRGLTPEMARGDFDATFSGHFHTPQAFGDDGLGQYLGAPMHWRFDDADRSACVWSVQFSETGAIEREPIESRAPRFHVMKLGAKLLKGVRKGDYVRLCAVGTATQAVDLKVRAEKRVDQLHGAGVRASWKLKLTQQHKDRARAAKVSGGGVQRSKLVPMYVKDGGVSTAGLDEELLIEIGQQALRATG